MLDGHPYLFWDTYGYFTQGRDYWAVILGLLGQGPAPPAAVSGWIGAAGKLLTDEPAVRSVSYSLLFWPAAVVGGFWPTAALHAVAAAYVVDVALDRLFGLGPGRRLPVLAALAALSSLPWFASYLMPDLFGGLMVLAMATLAFARDRLGAGQRVALTALVLLAASFHAANLPLALALAAAAAALAPAGRRLAVAARLGLPVAGAILLLATLGWLAFGVPSPAPRSPPFLLARQIEDGPTLPYLREACPRGEDWALCPLVDTLPAKADDFLWSSAISGYWGSPEPLRERLRREETALVLRAALARPLLQLRASAANALRQLAMVGLVDLKSGRGAVVSPGDYWYYPDRYVPLEDHDLGPFSALVTGTTAAGLAVVLRFARRPGGLPRAGWFLLLALVANAAVCGVLSGPHHRYQARVAWLLPLLAAALVARSRATPLRPVPPLEGSVPAREPGRPAPGQPPLPSRRVPDGPA